MLIYLKIDPAKFHPDPVWTCRTTGWLAVWDQFLIYNSTGLLLIDLPYICWVSSK